MRKLKSIKSGNVGAKAVATKGPAQGAAPGSAGGQAGPKKPRKPKPKPAVQQPEEDEEAALAELRAQEGLEGPTPPAAGVLALHARAVKPPCHAGRAAASAGGSGGCPG